MTIFAYILHRLIRILYRQKKLLKIADFDEYIRYNICMEGGIIWKMKAQGCLVK